MSRFQLPNMAYIKQDDNKYAGAFQALADALNRVSDQTNANPNAGQAPSPAQISSLSVVESGGIHDIQIRDNSPAYNGLRYHVQYSRDASFANAHTLDLGESQNHRANLGAGQYYWRAYSKYPTGQASDLVYHGGDTPAAVGSGIHAGPPMQQGQGFTGPFRNSTTPPVRG